MQPVLYFINLTAGLLVRHLDLYKKSHIIHIRSSHIESKAYDRLFYSLSDELLFHLAIGFKCVIVDCTSNRHSKIERVAVPIIKYVLYRRWFGIDGVKPKYIDDKFAEKVYKSLSKQTKKKLDYYKRFLDTEVIDLEAEIHKVDKEGELK